ncbi:peptidyl-prolyl cis/trans isomerase [Macrolepiota fuliginosa MF-IS2]|uniref:Peptidyl-prolyl cis-trans isomerase n=1 Tax=Macrolepiota fuliginosa MF-IS2 TaxID=1400762 RepID=A0A9P5XRB0_9AGAR|nr:peptidyl-prolyl cis/trans isomerase [Macrolepiota fuliginosa MF-IS2]
MSWEVRMSNSKGMIYFYNADTKESIWTIPKGFSEEQVMAFTKADKYKDQLKKLLDGEKGQVRASHLLVKHKDSRRPSSWKEANITRSKEEAIEILRGYQKEINEAPQKNEKFAELASLVSDCSSHSNSGDLGWFGPGQMQKAFEEATYSLEIGSVSDIVTTDSGVHLIFRTA